MRISVMSSLQTRGCVFVCKLAWLCLCVYLTESSPSVSALLDGAKNTNKTKWTLGALCTTNKAKLFFFCNSHMFLFHIRLSVNKRMSFIRINEMWSNKRTSETNRPVYVQLCCCCCAQNPVHRIQLSHSLTSYPVCHRATATPNSPVRSRRRRRRHHRIAGRACGLRS